jgi:hypothetical protein
MGMRQALTPCMIAVALVGVTSACPGHANAEDVAGNPCGEVALIGKVVHADYQGHIDGLDGAWRLDIDVGHVLRGSEKRQHIVATAVAHAQIRSDTNFIFFLMPGDGGKYRILSADLDLARGRATLDSCKSRLQCSP